MAVVDEEPFGVVAFAAGADGTVVVCLLLCDGVGETAGWIDVAEEDIDDGIAGLFTEESCINDSLEREGSD